MRLSGISNFKLTSFGELKSCESARKPEINNPYGFQIEVGKNPYNKGSMCYVCGYDEGGRQVAAAIPFDAKKSKNIQAVLNKALKDLYEQPQGTLKGSMSEDTFELN